MKFLNQLAVYLFLKKPDASANHGTWIKRMHGINRISIFIFLLGLIIIGVKAFIKK